MLGKHINYIVVDDSEEPMMHPEEPKKVPVTPTPEDLLEVLTPEARKALGKLRDKISTELFHGRGLTGRKLRRATASKLRKSIKLAKQGAFVSEVEREAEHDK